MDDWKMRIAAGLLLVSPQHNLWFNFLFQNIIRHKCFQSLHPIYAISLQYRHRPRWVWVELRKSINLDQNYIEWHLALGMSQSGSRTMVRLFMWDKQKIWYKQEIDMTLSFNRLIDRQSLSVYQKFENYSFVPFVLNLEYFCLWFLKNFRFESKIKSHISCTISGAKHRQI